MQFYPRENFLLLRTEDINREPYKMLTEITEFLGLDAVSEDEVKVWVSKSYNVHKKHGSIDPDKLVMRQESKDMLNDFFKPYNTMLSELTGNENFLWTESST